MRTVENGPVPPPSLVSDIQVTSIVGGGSSASGDPCESVKRMTTFCLPGAAGSITRCSRQLAAPQVVSLRLTPPARSTPVGVAGLGVLGGRGVTTGMGVDAGVVIAA